MENKSRLWSIVSYITWVGWIVAFLLHDKQDSLSHHHVNQSLLINIIETVGLALTRLGGVFAFAGYLIQIGAFVLWVMGIVRAIRQSEEPLPVIGGIKLIP